MKRLLTFIDDINNWMGKILSLWIIIIAALMLFEILSRYFFNAPTVWAEESSTYIFGVMVVLGGGYTFLEGSMVNMDILYARFDIKGKAIIDICTTIFALIVCVILIWKSGTRGWESLVLMEKSSSIWGIPVYPLRLAVPAGAFLLLLQVIAKFIRDLCIVFGRKNVKC